MKVPGVKKNTVTSTHRDIAEKPILVLIPAGAGKSDGTANFLRHGRMDKLVIAGGDFLRWEQLRAEALKRPRYLALVRLWNGHRTRNVRAIKQAMAKLYSPKVAEVWSLPSGDMFASASTELKNRLPAQLADALRPAELKESDLLRAAPWHLPNEFSSRMNSARIVLWWNWRAKRCMPAIYCRTITTALFVLAALQEVSACPMCHTPFTPTRRGQEYCSIACRERFRQQRRREKIKKGKGATK